MKRYNLGREYTIEVEDVVFTGEWLEGDGKDYRVTGSAVIDGETYSEFVIEFELAEAPDEETPEAIMNAEWESYDFVFSGN